MEEKPFDLMTIGELRAVVRDDRNTRHQLGEIKAILQVNCLEGGFLNSLCASYDPNRPTVTNLCCVLRAMEAEVDRLTKLNRGLMALTDSSSLEDE